MARDFYAEANPNSEEIHPVDAAVARRLPRGRLLREIRAATAAMVEALDSRRDLWLKLEDLTTRFRMDREECYFNLGYELGATAGRTEAFARSARRGSSAQRKLAAGIRYITVEAELPPSIKLATLLETAWTLVVGASGRLRSLRSEPRGRGGNKRSTTGTQPRSRRGLMRRSTRS